MTIYTIAIAVAMPIAGKLSDDLGRRRVLFGGLMAFIVSSLLCAIAPSIHLLIFGRALQGVSAGSLMPSAYGIVGDMFVEVRAQAIGFLSSVPAVGAVIGPNIGGVSVDLLSWRFIFLVNLPLAIVALIILALYVRGKETRHSRSLDFVGAVLLGIAITAVLYALTELGRPGESPSIAIVGAMTAVAAVAGALFTWHETRVNDPVLDLDLVAAGDFAYINLMNFLYGASTFGMSTFLPLYVQAAYGMTPTESGFVLSGRAVAISIASIAASMLLPWSGYRRPIVLGMVIVATALFGLALGLNDPKVLGLSISNFAFISILAIIVGLGHGITGPASNNAALELAPERVASLAGLRGMFRFIGGAIGIAVVIMFASRSSSVGTSLEISFAGLAVITILTTLLVTRIPEMPKRDAVLVRSAS